MLGIQTLDVLVISIWFEAEFSDDRVPVPRFRGDETSALLPTCDDQLPEVEAKVIFELATSTESTTPDGLKLLAVASFAIAINITGPAPPVDPFFLRTVGELGSTHKPLFTVY